MRQQLKFVQIETALSTLNMLQVGPNVAMVTKDMDRIVVTILEGKHQLAMKQYFNQLDIKYEN